MGKYTELGSVAVDPRERKIRDDAMRAVGDDRYLKLLTEFEVDNQIAARAEQRKQAEAAPPEVAGPAKEMMANLHARRQVLGLLRNLTPEQRAEALKIAPGIAQGMGDDRGNLATRAIGAVRQGVSDFSQPIMEMAGVGGTPEEIDYIRQLQAAANQEANPARPDDPWYQRGPVQAAGMVPYAISTVAGGVAGSALGRVGGQLLARAASAGVPGARAAFQATGAVGGLAGATTKATMAKAGELAGITATSFPAQYVQEVEQLKEIGMEDNAKLRLLAGGTAAVTGLIEGIVPNPFVGKVPLTEGAAKAARQYLWEAAKKAPGEMSEEYLQGVTSGLGKHVAQYLDENAEDKTVSDAFKTGWEQTKEAALPMAFLLGVPAASGAGLSAMQARRLTQLQEARAKGFVSAEDAKALGIEGTSRKERLANTDAEIERLQNETQGNGTSPQPATLEERMNDGSQVESEGQTQTAEQTQTQGQADVQVGRQEGLLTNEEAARIAAERVAQRRAAQQPADTVSASTDLATSGLPVPEQSKGTNDREAEQAAAVVPPGYSRVVESDGTQRILHEATGTDVTEAYNNGDLPEQVAERESQLSPDIANLPRTKNGTLAVEAIGAGVAKTAADRAFLEQQGMSFNTEMNRWDWPGLRRNKKPQPAPPITKPLTTPPPKSTAKSEPKQPTIQIPAKGTTLESEDADTVSPEGKVKQDRINASLERFKKDFGETWTPVEPESETEHEAAALAKRLGLTPVFFTSDRNDEYARSGGYVGGDVVFIKRGLGDAVWGVVGDEIAHGTKLDLADFATSEEVQWAKDDYLSRIPEEHRAALKANTKKLDREAKAHMVRTFMEQKSFRDKLHNDNPKLWRRIVDAVLSLFNDTPLSNKTQQAVLDELRARLKGKKQADTAKPEKKGRKPKVEKPADTMSVQPQWQGLSNHHPKPPTTLFHGTRASGPLKAGQGKSVGTQGIWLVGTEQRAKDFAEGRPASEGVPNVRKFNVRMQNPAAISNDDALNTTVDELKAAGFDGAYIIDTGFWVAFDADQLTEQPTAETKPPSKEQGKKPSDIVDTIAGRMNLDEFEAKGYDPSQVTRADWTNLQRANRRKLGQPEESGTAAAPYADYESYHEDAVKRAIAAGDEVDPEVLKDYPELQKSSGPKGPFTVEWGTRSLGNQTEDFENYDEAVKFYKKKSTRSDFVTLYDSAGEEIDLEGQSADTKPQDVASDYKQQASQVYDILAQNKLTKMVSYTPDRISVVAGNDQDKIRELLTKAGFEEVGKPSNGIMGFRKQPADTVSPTKKINSASDLPPLPDDITRATHFTDDSVAAKILTGEPFTFSGKINSTTDAFSNNDDVFELLNTGKSGAFTRSDFGNSMIIMDMPHMDYRKESMYQHATLKVDNSRILGVVDTKTKVFTPNPNYKSPSQIEQFESATPPGAKAADTMSPDTKAEMKALVRAEMDKQIGVAKPVKKGRKKPAESKPSGKKRTGKKEPTRIQKAADNARQEADDLWAKLNSMSKDKLTSGLDPELASVAVSVALAEIKAKTLTFAAFVERAVAKVPAEMLQKLKPYLEMAWEVAHDRGMTQDPAGTFDDALANTKPQPVYEVAGDDGMLARVFKHEKGWSVTLTDKDTEETLPFARIYPSNRLAEAKRYADSLISGITDMVSADYGTVENPNRVELGKYFAKRFAEGTSYARITDARREAAELLGGTPKDGTSAIKDIDESVEIGVVLNAREIAQSGLSDSEIYDQLVDLYKRQPNLGTRTSTSMAEQAYSTPAPLAFAVNRRAGVTPEDTVYDSSAGNGMLLIVGGERYANELNPDRAESLRSQGITTTSEDATEFTLDKPINALVINPPFGQVKDAAGKLVYWNIDGVRTDKVDHAITLQSLKDIPDDGKVAIIIGAKGFEKREPKSDSQRGVAYLGEKKFYDALYDGYNVVDHFTVHGDLYSRQGASFPVDVIIIEGKGKSQRPKPYNITGGGIPAVIRTWEELKDAKLRPVDRVSSANTRGSEGTDTATVEGGNEGSTAGNAEKLSTESTSGRVGGQDRRKPGSTGLGKPDGQPGVANTTGRTQGAPRKPDADQSGGSNQGQRNADRPSGPDSGNRVKPDETAETTYQVSYSPGSTNQSVDTLIPRNHQSAVTKSLEAVADTYGDIDQFVADELGYSRDELAEAFSAEQVDALALAIARHKDGGAFIIGDQTGVGKGRAAAAMMVYAGRQGLVPVFITEKPTLYADMVRDLVDIGRSTDDAPFNVLMTNALSGKDVVPLPDGRSLKQSSAAAQKNLAVAVQSVLDGGSLTVETGRGKNKETVQYNAIFTTYSQMQPVKQVAPERANLLRSISPKAFYILDESHNAGGGADSDPNANQDRRSSGQDATITRAEIVRSLIGDAAGVYFSSATYAKRPQTMGLYARTGMTAATDNDATKLSDAIVTGGVPLQQVVSEQLVESGMYLRRERSFDGVQFDPKTVNVDLSNLDNVAAIFNAINDLDKYAQDAIAELQDEVTSGGGAIRDTEATGEAGVESTSFSSILHNLVDQMLLAVKADAVADETIASIKAGESPVIYVDSTLEAALKRQVDDMNVNIGDVIDFSYRDLVRRYLERSREYTVRNDLEDPDSVERVRLTDEQLGPDGVAAYERALEMIDSFEGDMPASPIDWIRKRVTDAGYSIGEITGRQVVLDYGDDGLVRLGKRPDEEAGAGGRTATVKKFNDGTIDAVLINQSGSTGISMHASEKFANQKPRHMIIGQPSRNIDTFMQALGRVHRTGQVVLPRFTLMMTNAPAEIRPASVLVKKLASLNANVTASAKGSVSFDVPDVINVIGDQVVAEYLADNPDLDRAIGELVQLRSDGTPKKNYGIAKKASGRMALRPVAEQQQFWDSVVASYNELVDELNRIGKNPLVAATLDLQAKTLESTTIFDGDTSSANAFLQPASIEMVRANKPGSPMTPAEVTDAVSAFYGKPVSRSVAIEWLRATHKEAKEAFDAYVAAQTKDLEGEQLENKLAFLKALGERQLAALMNRLQQFAPGMSVTVYDKNADGSIQDFAPGFVTKVKRAKGGNPLAGSKWSIEIAIASPDRIAKTPLSRTGEQTPEGADNYREYLSNNELIGEQRLKEFEETDASPTEVRYIGVGNVLAAYSQLGKSGGQIVFFTDASGSVRRGVLMPRSFKLDKWAEARPVVLDTIEQVRQFLASGNYLNTPDKALNLMMLRGDLVVRAPKSKSKGGKYTLNPTIRAAAAPQEFVSIGSRMEMVISDRAQQDAVLSAIMSVASLQADSDKKLARQIIEAADTVSAAKREVAGDTGVLYQTANVNPQVVIQATDLAIDAQDAGITTFDELVAFSVKTIGEQRTRAIGQYLTIAGDAVGLKGVRPTDDVLGMPGVTREQATTMAKAAFPMLSDEQIEAGIALQDATGFGRDEIGYAPFGTPVPRSQAQSDALGVKGWTQFISATRAIIGATGKADVSTFIHEFFHPMRKFLLNRDIPAESRAGITDEDIQALEDYAGVKDGKWTVEAEEKAAKAWEQYWFEGKSPTSGLKSLFEKLATWMRQVYEGVHQITGGQLPPEVRKLFDKIVQRGGYHSGGDTMSADDELPDDNSLTSIKNEVMNDLRLQRGLPELADVAAQTQQEWLDTAESMLAADRRLGDRLVKEINAKPRNLSNIEVAVLQMYYREINNSLTAASDRLFTAKDEGDSVRAAEEQTTVDQVLETLAEIEDASKAAGREWGRSGVARQIVLRKDFSLAGLMRKARVANGGNALNKEQQAEIAELAKRVAELEAQLAKSEQEKADLERKQRVDKGLEDEKKKTPKAPRTTARKKAADAVSAFKAKFADIFKPKSATDTLQQTEEERMAEEAKAVVDAYVQAGVFSFGEFMANVKRDIGSDLPVEARVAFASAWADASMAGEIPTPDVDATDLAGMTRLARRIQRSLVESGITEREDVVDAVHESLQEIMPDITRRETMDALSGYGQFTPLSKDEISKTIRGINGELQQLAKLEDMQAGQAPLKTGAERRTPTDEERRLTKLVNEAKRRGGFRITDPAAQLRSAMDAAKTAIRNRIVDLQYEIDNRRRIVRTKTELVPDAELESLRKQRDALLEVHKGLFPKPGATMAQRIAAANRAIDAAIANVEEQLRTGNVAPKGRKEPISTPELDAKRARLEALRAQRDAIRALANPKLTPEERADRAYKAALLKRIADYQDRMNKNEFDPPARKELRVLTPEQLTLKKQLEDVKDQFFRKAAEYRLANMSSLQKAWDYTKETSHLSRAIMTSVDLSAVFRQGGVASFAHPKLAAETSREMLQAVLSTQAEFKAAENIRNDPLYQFAMTAKLSITEDEGKITRQEEAYMGRWARHGLGKEGTAVNKASQFALAPVAASARAYTTFLNGMRFKLFKLMVENLGKGGQVTLDEAKVIAHYINVATGRADLGKYNQVLANMSTVFFAPRYVLSRFQYFAMPFYLLPSSKVSGRVKKAIALEYARYATGLGIFLGAAVALGSLLFDDDDDDEKPTVELDPRSSDFMKIKIGETRIDPLSGFSQTVAFVSQVALGRKKSVNGEIQDLRGEGHKFGQPDTWSVMADFGRKKFAPIPSAVTNVITGENVIGEKVTALTAARDLFVPLSLSEISDTMQARGVPAGSAITILSLLGMGGGTYGPKTQYANGTEAERAEQFAKDLKAMQWDSPDPAYSDLLTREQYEQVQARREERKQNLAYAAMANPVKNKGQSDESYEKEVAERDKALESLRNAGWTAEQTRQLLIDHWKLHRERKESVKDRLRRINRVFAAE